MRAATTLGALNIGAGTPGTVIYEVLATRQPSGEVVEVRAAHAAGVAVSNVKFERGQPVSVVMKRTARKIMEGEVFVPERFFDAAS